MVLMWISMGMILYLLHSSEFGEARGINLGICDDTLFDCRCGRPGYIVPIAVKQCTGFHRWKPKCRPCNKESKELICHNYQYCMDCEANVNRCTRCPRDKYGTWCTLDCQCQNGAKCRQDDGSCECTEGFTGNLCEVPLPWIGELDQRALPPQTNLKTAKDVSV